MAASILYLLAFTLISGLTPICGRLAVQEVPWMTLAWIRFAVAGGLLYLTARRQGRRLPFRRDTIWPLLGIAALCVPLNQFGYLQGLALANASHGGVFYALSPVLIFWGAVLLRRSRFRWTLCCASLLAFGGAACVTVSSGEVGFSTDPRMLRGDLLLLFAVSTWALYSLLSKPYVERHGAVATLSAVCLLGAALHTPLVLLDLPRYADVVITWRGVVGTAYLTLVTSFINYLLWYVVIARHDISKASVIVNTNFLITVLLGYLFLDESINLLFVIGAVLTLCGIALVAWDHVGRLRRAPAAASD